MITYTLPDFTSGLGLNLFFVRMLSLRPDWFQRDVRIGSVYGSFPGCIMNGGRAYVRDKVEPVQMEKTFAILEEYGVLPRLTLTNMMLGKQHLADTYANEMLSAAARHGGEAIVYADFVGDYVRERYGMKTVLSTTRPVANVDELNALAKHYDWVVLDYNHHKDEDYLGAIKQPGKAEIMVNEFCMVGCPHRGDHYRHNSEDQLAGAMHPFSCHAQRADFFEHKAGHPVIFTNVEIRHVHDTHGIENFKIVGRGVPFETNLEALAYYLVRPEYRDHVKSLVRQQAGK